MVVAYNAHAARSPAIIRTLRCRSCAKLHRVRELPRDACGRLALQFRFTCLGCGHIEATCLHEIVTWPPASGGAPESRGPCADIGGR